MWCGTVSPEPDLLRGESGLIRINGIEFEPIPGVKYENNYVKCAEFIASGKWKEGDAYHTLLRRDLFFLVYFGLGIKTAHHPFVVQACRDVQHGSNNLRLDLWAREHFKSTIITIAETIRTLANDPEERIAIFSWSRENSRAFTFQLKTILEQNEFIRHHFPHLIWENPGKDSPAWSVDKLILRRQNAAKEASIEPWGLVDGMPTGRHFTGRIYDDVEVEKFVNTPELITKVKDAFHLSHNCGVAIGSGGWHRVIGTHYHHDGLLQELREMKDGEGKLIYESCIKPATHDGTANGKSVLMEPAELELRKRHKRHFYCQQLLDPTPAGERKLESQFLRDIDPGRYSLAAL